ncbi:hypothetical protein [Staphylococcus gallinarum]|uniref:hypothetical protein n=1 Tax=Staphylococcus gallinarum TaxID=1293 RepID=UPI0030BB8E2B
MNVFKNRIEELDKGINYVSNHKYRIDMDDRERTYYNAAIRSIRGDIKVTNKYILNNLEELSKNDIKVLLQKIVEIESKFS